jgi:hypothetical protein
MNVTTRADLEKAGEFLVAVAKGSHDAVTEVSVEIDELLRWTQFIDLWVVISDTCDLQEVKDAVKANMRIAARIFEAPAGVQLEIRAMVRREGAEGDAYESAWRLGGEAALEALEALGKGG